MEDVGLLVRLSMNTLKPSIDLPEIPKMAPRKVTALTHPLRVEKLPERPALKIEMFDWKVKIEDFSKSHYAALKRYLASTDDSLFVFDFDGSLATTKESLHASGYRTDYGVIPDGAIIPLLFSGYEEKMAEKSKINPFVVVTKRKGRDLEIAEEYLRRKKFNCRVYGTPFGGKGSAILHKGWDMHFFHTDGHTRGRKTNQLFFYDDEKANVDAVNKLRRQIVVSLILHQEDNDGLHVQQLPPLSVLVKPSRPRLTKK